MPWTPKAEEWCQTYHNGKWGDVFKPTQKWLNDNLQRYISSDIPFRKCEEGHVYIDYYGNPRVLTNGEWMKQTETSADLITRLQKENNAFREYLFPGHKWSQHESPLMDGKIKKCDCGGLLINIGCGYTCQNVTWEDDSPCNNRLMCG